MPVLGISGQLYPKCASNGSVRAVPYGHPWAMTNYTMAFAKRRLIRVRTRSQPFIRRSTYTSCDSEKAPGLFPLCT
jgi:hypothetical protein